jgi:hypothetical protein
MAKEQRDIVAEVLGSENITLDTRLEELLEKVESTKAVLQQRKDIETRFNQLGVPDVTLPATKPPTFNPNMATLDDQVVGNDLGAYSAWIAYLKNYISMKEMDIIFSKQALHKTLQLLAKKYRASGARASEADSLVAMDNTVLALQELIMEFEIEKKLAESRLGPFQDYAKALSREISRRAPETRGFPGIPTYAGPEGALTPP